MISFEQVKQIMLPGRNWQEIVKHCERKLAGKYLPGESRVRRAYGLVAGTHNERTLNVQRIFPLKINVRDKEPYKTYMNGVMRQYAVPSKAPMSTRGWITDPEELKACYDKCDQEGLIVLGTYHAHMVPWDDDPIRDTPTLLDTVLARDSNLFSFIVSMVDMTRPRVRAFYEGSREKEIPVLLQDGQLAEGAKKYE